MQSAPISRLSVVIPFIVVTMLWGSTWVVIRGQLDNVPLSWSVSYRFVIAGLAMFALAFMRRQSLWIGWPGIGFAALVGLSQFALNFNLVYRAELHITSGLVALLFALMIIPNSLIGRWLFGEIASAGFVVGSTFATIGVGLLLLQEYRSVANNSSDVLIGIGFALGGVSCATAANLLQASPRARALPILSTLAWAMILGSVANVIWAWITAGPPVFDTRPGYILGMLYLAIAGSVITFPLYFGLIQQIGAGRAAYTGVAIPVIAMLLSTIVEGYVWSPMAASGAALAFVGMVVALWTRGSKAARPSR